MFKIKSIIFLSFFIFSSIGFSQEEKMAKALNFLQSGNLDSAKISIDQAVQNASTANNGQAWYIRGFVYKSLYNTNEKSNKESPSRIIAAESFIKSMELDATAQNISENKKSIKYLSSTFYNDAASSLNFIDYSIAVTNFEKFVEYYSMVDTSKKFLNEKKIEFNLAIASVYLELFRADKKKYEKYFEMAKASYGLVLKLDPNNISACYNMGIIYYNQAVDLINESDYGIDFDQLKLMQDNYIILAKQALPFAQKAHELDPKRTETIVALTGIYLILNEYEKYDSYMKKLEEIRNKK